MLRVPPAMWRASTASIMRSWKGPTACGTAGSKGPVWVLLSWYAGVCPLHPTIGQMSIADDCQCLAVVISQPEHTAQKDCTRKSVPCNVLMSC